MKLLSKIAKPTFVLLILLQTTALAIAKDSQKTKNNPEELLKQLGAKGVSGATDKQLKDYSAIFSRTDSDNDNCHSEDEYVKNSRHMNPKARKMIFRAANNNNDEFVTRVEYILNRIITDEAKRIMQPLDTSKDNKIQKNEFIKGIKLSEDQAKIIFAKLDTNNDGELIIPEYLRVWGKWARQDYKKQEKLVKNRLKDITQASTSKLSDRSKKTINK